MKISNNISAANTILSSVNNRQAVSSFAEKNGRVKPDGRFDSFVMTGTEKNVNGQNSAKKLNTEQQELLRNLDNLSEDEKETAAVCSYIDMQRCCKSAADRQETDIAMFKSLQEQKSYYNELLEKDGVISDKGGKYDFAGVKAGMAVDKSSIKQALADVQKKIGYLTQPPTENTKMYELTDSIYRSAAQTFKTVTGIEDSALELDDDSLCKVREGLTEENYLQKAEENLNSIKNRSKQLGKIFSDYANGNPEIIEKLGKYGKTDSAYNKKQEQLRQAFEKYTKEINSTPFELKLTRNLFTD